LVSKRVAPVCLHHRRQGLPRAKVIDRGVALRSGIKVGDTIEIRSTQGVEDEFFRLNVVGMVDSQSYFFQPTIFVSPATWEKIRPQSEADLNSDTLSNILRSN
jgi:putative ABC transport system permease protein